MLLRLLLWGILFYLIYKFLGNVFRSIFGIGEHKNAEVKGRGKDSSLNLDDQDIEDADFEEIK